MEASARVAGDERLDRIALQLSELVEGSVVQRADLLAAAASDPLVRTLLLSDVPPDSARLTAVLEELASPSDSVERVEILDEELRVRFALGGTALPIAAGERVDFRVPDEGGYGPWIDYGGRLFTGAAVPIRVQDRTVGYILHLRPFGTPATASTIEELIGGDASVYFVEEGGRWVDLTGEVIAAPEIQLASGALTYARAGGEQYIARVAPVAGTPWHLVAELRLADVLAGSNAFLERMIALLLLLISVGAAAAWVLSRRFTGPLKDLSGAARMIATGDYTHRVDLDRSDEIGTLAEAFNSMAAQVQRGDAELKLQVDQARTLADELEEANARLLTLMRAAESARLSAEDASRAKSDFLATVSHEIRTPINAIIGYTDLLLMGIPEPPTVKQTQQLERIRESSARLTRLIDDVLDLAKIEAGRLQVDISAGVVEDVVRTTISMTEPLAARKRVEVGTTTDLDGHTLYSGDPGRVEQIVLNLVGNAVKFTPAGGRVTIGCQTPSPNDGEDAAEGAEVRITVSDTGPGISVDKQELIFDRFVQGDSGYRRPHEGAGLGLAISRELARLMGGDIIVESAEGEGSTFTLILPAPPGASSDEARSGLGASASA